MEQFLDDVKYYALETYRTIRSRRIPSAILVTVGFLFGLMF